MNKYVFILLLFGLSFGGCKQKDEGSLDIQFSATYGGEDLVFLESYPVDNSFSIQFTKSDFYISDLTLVEENGTEVILSDVEFIDFTEAYGSNPPRKFELNFDNIPHGTYTKIKFGLGVAPALNSTLPAEFNADHPLAKTSHYWGPWNSYIFTKLEGRLDTLGNGTHDYAFLYHTGTNDIYQVMEFAAAFVIADDQENIEIQLDYKELINPTSGSILPVLSSPLNHDPNNIEAFKTIVDNFMQSINVIM